MPETFRDDPNDSAVDPGTLGPDANSPRRPRPQRTTQTLRRQRTTTRGATGPRKAQDQVQVDLSSITGLFVGLHLVLAQTTGTPEIAITDEEGEQFMSAAQKVMRHYNVQTTQKTFDWVALMGVSETIYGTRLYAIMQKEPVKPQAPSRGPATVTPIRPMAPQSAAVEAAMTIMPDAFGAGDIPAE